jgi:hypothetical protein
MRGSMSTTSFGERRIDDRLTTSAANVRFGSKADIPRHSHLCPLLGVKRTLNACFLNPKRRPAAGDFDRRREGHLNLD